MDLMTLALRFVPKNLLSLMVGCLARLRLPGALGRWLVAAFARVFRIDMREAEHPLEHYRTIEDLFTRRLRAGSRPVQAPICSPSDGILAVSGPADRSLAVQAKGLTYHLKVLVYDRDPDRPHDFEPAWFQTVYLAPHNYHRVHAPFAGRLERIRYIPGELWPVNGMYVRRVVDLFTRNERMVFDFALEGGGRAYVVMVGALNVGRMITPWAPELVSNAAMRQLVPQLQVHSFAEPPQVSIGEELGTFMLGSTVVIVYDKLSLSGIDLIRSDEPRPVLMGQSLVV